MLDDNEFLDYLFSEVERRVSISPWYNRKGDNESLFFITIDNYFPPEEHWDIDEFEAKQLTLAFNRCGKKSFKEAYSLARALANDLKMNADRGELISQQEALDALRMVVLMRGSNALPLCSVISPQGLR